MNNSKEIAKLLADGKPWSGDQLREALGLTRDEFLSAICSLRLKGLAVNAPVTYTITPKGKKYAAHVPLAAAARMRKTREGEAKRLAQEEAMRAKDLATVVDRAMQSRHPLQMAWGAMNA